MPSGVPVATVGDRRVGERRDPRRPDPGLTDPEASAQLCKFKDDLAEGLKL